MSLDISEKPRQRSVQQAVNDLKTDAGLLIRQEIALAKAEVKEKVAAVAKQAAIVPRVTGPLTVNVWPAMVMVPVRAGPVFAATVKLTDPVPVPAAPAVIVIHDGALLTAVHAHVAPVVTAIAVPAPPAAAIDSLVEAIV